MRVICKYLSAVYSIELMDVLQNGIGPLGCEFLGKSMLSPLCMVRQLKLDDNNILTEGLRNLTLGLRTNNVLDKLSLKYCGIDGEGAKYIQEILANINSRLRSLKLQGRCILFQGINWVMRVCIRYCVLWSIVILCKRLIWPTLG